MDDIEGQIIQNVQDLAGKRPEALSWTVDVHSDSVVLEIGDGSLLIPVSDVEGNRPGVFQGKGVDQWQDLRGSLIMDMAPISLEAMEYHDWDSSGYRPPVLTLDTGEQLYPVADPEGNQSGVLLRVQDGETFIIDFEPADAE